MEWKKLLGLVLVGGLAMACPKDPENCGDGVDNDENGQTDCDDAACANVAVCQPQVEDCDVVGDEDGDGDADCVDSDCAAEPQCNPPLCPNGVVDAGEDCDGNNFGGRDCTDFDDPDGNPFAGGQLACNADCSANTANCQSNENCTDNQDNDGDGDTDCADADCAADPTCLEAGNCDDTLDNDGDNLVDCLDLVDCATDPLCTETGAECQGGVDDDGDGLIDCLDPDCAADPACVVNNCGNGNIDAGEECDGANFGTATCSSETAGAQPAGSLACNATCQIDATGCTAVVCNNDGVVDAANGEQCDDGTAGTPNGNGDGCEDTCLFTPDFEQENNDTQATANVFVAIDVVPAGGDGQIKGFIPVTADKDFFRVTIPAGQVGDIRAETLDGPLGTTCVSNNLDSQITILDAAGIQLATDDDLGAGFCSLVTPTGLGEGDYFIIVEDSIGFGGAPFDYTLAITISNLHTPTCGDNVAEGTEACDGNDLNGGNCGAATGGVLAAGTVSCNATCDGFDVSQCTAALTDLEPNNNVTEATDRANNDGILLIDGSVVTPGSITNTGGVDSFDFFAIQINVITDIKLEVFDGTGAPNCAGGIDPDLQLIDDDGVTVLVSDDLDGPAFCPKIDSVTDAPARRLTPGLYFVRVNDFGNNNDIAQYTLVVTFNALCGDGVVEGSELLSGFCDDGDQTNGNGCENDCTVTPICGNTVIEAANGETCDGTALGGQSCLTQGFSSGNILCVAPGQAGECTFDTSGCVAECGDGVPNSSIGEQCDDGGRCEDGTTACTTLNAATACAPGGVPIDVNGDGTASCAPIAGDGCDNTCLAEPEFEIELNNTVATANTFAAIDADANGQIKGSINPIGDFDFFAFDITVPSDVRIEVLDATGVACPTGFDPDLQFIDTNGTTVLVSDDLDSPVGPGFCPLINAGAPTNDANAQNRQPGTYFIRVNEFGNNNVIGQYTLILTLSPLVCGNNIAQGAEVCDGTDLRGQSCATQGFASGIIACNAACSAFDISACLAPVCGNGSTTALESGEECELSLLNSDCENNAGICNIVGSTDELEPNNNAADADTAGAITATTTIVGAIADVTDEKDFFRVDIAAPTTVRFETFTSLGDCAAGTTTTLRFFAADGTTQIATDTTSGIRSCSALILPLNIGTYYVQVEETGTNASVPLYVLDVVFQSDLGTETETAGATGANDTSATAEVFLDGASDSFSISDHPANDTDFFAITLPPGFGIRAEVIEPTNVSLAADLTCNANNIDADLHLVDAGTGTEIVTDDLDGRGFCPLIDGTGSAPLDSAAFNGTQAPKSFFLFVDGFDNTDIFGYRVVVTVREGAFCGDGIRNGAEACDDGVNGNGDGCEDSCILTPVCGNGTIEAGEQCEPPNVGNCDANCQVSGITAEAEPNGSTAEADANGLSITDDILIGGSITDVTDELDFFRVDITTVPTVVRFETFTAAGNCAAGTTTTLRLRDSAGAQIITDSTSGISSCSAIVFPFQVAGTFYIEVEETGTNANVPLYFLEAQFLDDTGAETETVGATGTNENSTTAEQNMTLVNNAFVFGDHTLAGTGISDRDFYAITVPNGLAIRAEIVEGDTNPAKTCESNNLDSEITLFAANGTTILENDDDTGRGFCSLIDGTGATPLDALAKNTTGADATFFIEVRESDIASAGDDVFSYRLVLTVR